jgi:glycosyltransferase involved in cell wall biosynthesis
VQVAGYFKGVMGTGEHARQLAGALQTQGIPVVTRTLHPDGSPEDDQLALQLDDAGSLSGDGHAADPYAQFNLLCANADMVPAVATQLGEEFFAGRYTIGFWAWEVSAFPEAFLPAFSQIDEVWVGSRHVRDAVAAIATVPVITIPQPVALAPDADRAPPPPDLPSGFRFLFAFDYLSVFERKNPLATIAAFTRAFAPGSDATLIIKTINDDCDTMAHERVRAAVAAHPDIHLIEQRLTRPDRDGLLNAADCYVSLHRAEGFGYTLAESMWLGKPVIATGYSGNLDFMTPANSYLVNHHLVPIGPGNPPYPADGQWAEPDIEHAAALMREVYERRDEARDRGKRAAAEVRSSHGPEAAGRAMARRLDLLITSLALSHRRSLRASAERASELIRTGPVPPGHARFGALQRAVRSMLLRLLKPVTVHQGLIDDELLRTMAALDASVDSLARSQEATARRIEELRRSQRGERVD